MIKFPLLLLLLLSFLYGNASWDISYPYKAYSTDSLYYLESIPFSAFDNTKLGITKVFRKENNKIKCLYSFDRYFSSDVVLYNNGTNFISFLLGSNSNHKLSDTVINFYHKENIITSYSLLDLGLYSYENNVATSSSYWGFTPTFPIDTTKKFLKSNPTFFVHDTFCIIFSDMNIRFFESNTGKYLGKSEYNIFFKNHYISHCKQSGSMEYNYDVIYPNPKSVLISSNGEDINEKILNIIPDSLLQKIEFIQIVGILNKRGRCEILRMYFTGQKTETNLELENKIRMYLTKKRYKASVLPPNVKFWQFEYFISLKPPPEKL